MFRIKYIGFDNGWPDFKVNNPIIRALTEKDITVNKTEEANTIVIGSFLTLEEFNEILNFRGKRILYLSEPIENLQSCYYCWILFKNKMYDAVTGCIIQNRMNKWYKHSLYRISFDYSNPQIFEVANRFVKESSLEKNYCALINRHDWGNCRVKIHDQIKKYGRIDCPGALLNNMRNEYVNRLGIPAFLKDYLFYICCENFGNSHPGYITEKLMGCCLGGAIPIYYGKLDEHDREIFNEERILFVDLENLDALEEKVKNLMENPELLEKFYRQDVFKKDAYRKLMEMDKNIVEMVDDLRREL